MNLILFQCSIFAKYVNIGRPTVKVYAPCGLMELCF